MENNISQNDRWRLILGSFAEQSLPFEENGNGEIDDLVNFLYNRQYSEDAVRGDSDSYAEVSASNETAEPYVVEWINKVREIFSKETVEIMQKDAVKKYNMVELLQNKETLEKMQPDFDLLKQILSFKEYMNNDVVHVAKKIIEEVVRELSDKLKQDIKPAINGKRNLNSRALKTLRNFDYKKTIKQNLKNYNVEYKTIIPENIYFIPKIKKYNEYNILIAVDQSGSMLDSIIYSAITASIFATLPALNTKIFTFSTSIVDMSDYLSDIVEFLMNVQLNGGTDIYMALEYLYRQITEPAKTIAILVSDLYEYGNTSNLYRVASSIIESGAKLIVLPALDNNAHGVYDKNVAKHLANLGAEVGAVTPKELSKWISKIIS